MMMNNPIKLKIIGHIEITPETNKEPFYNKSKKNIVKRNNPGVLIERRNHKVKTDENKLYGTRESHKYY